MDEIISIVVVDIVSGWMKLSAYGRGYCQWMDEIISIVVVDIVHVWMTLSA